MSEELTKVEFYVGIGQTREQNQIPGPIRDYIVQRIDALLTERFGGFTRIVAEGGYRHADGSVVVEPSRVWSTFVPRSTSVASINDLAERLAKLADQESVLVAIGGATGHFVSPDYAASDVPEDWATGYGNPHA